MDTIQQLHNTKPTASVAPGAAEADARPAVVVLSNSASPKAWCVYLLECRSGVMYAGITNDLAARFEAHQAGRGARFTRANPPLRILAHRSFADRSAASKAEWALKKLRRAKKLAFLTTHELKEPT